MDDTLRKHLDGFSSFQRRHAGRDRELFQALRKGQRPRIMLVACSDSRVDPAILTGCKPGELFVVRNIANLIPPYVLDDSNHGVSAALEYAVKELRVEHVIVKGHSSCGGIKALLRSEQLDQSEFLGRWLAIAAPARERALAECGDPESKACRRSCEQNALLLSLDNLMSFPFVRERVEAGALKLHAWYYDLHTLALHGWDEEAQCFVELVEAADRPVSGT